MSVMFIPFGPWQMDDWGLLNFANGTSGPPMGYQVMMYARGVVPIKAGGYTPYGTGVTGSASIATTYPPNSVFVHRANSVATAGGVGSYYSDNKTTYVGTPADLWEFANPSVNVTKTIAGQYLTDAGAAAPAALEPMSWYFISWGDIVLATNIACAVQRQATRGSRFIDCITSAAKPKARYISSLGQHVVLANVVIPTGGAGGTGLATGPHTQMIWWSKTDDERSFSDPATDPSWNSDYQELVEINGPIRGLAKVGDDVLVIFKPEGCHVMQRTGDARLFSFQVLHTGPLAGTCSGRSIVVHGKDIYYVSNDGVPCVMRGLGEPEPLTQSVIETYIRRAGGLPAPISYPLGLLSTYFIDNAAAVINSTTELITWMIWDQGSNNMWFLHYSIPNQSFSIYTTPNGTQYGAIENSTSVGVINAFTYANPIRAADFSMAAISGSAYSLRTGKVNLTPVEPNQLGLGSELSAIKRVRPVFSGPFSNSGSGGAVYPAIKVTVHNDLSYNTINVPFNFRTITLDATAGTSVDSHGWYTPPGGSIVGEMFDFEMYHTTAPAPQIRLLGVEVEADQIARR